jgi:hypothetical protein
MDDSLQELLGSSVNPSLAVNRAYYEIGCVLDVRVA